MASEQKEREEKKQPSGLDDEENEALAVDAFSDLQRATSRLADPADARTLSEAFGALVGNDLLSDVTFVVGKEESHVFEELLFKDAVQFKSATGEAKRQSIPLPDVKPHIFRLMLESIYADKIGIRAEDFLDLMTVARRFKVTGLIGMCEEFMATGITPENACKLYMLAHEAKGDTTEQAAKLFILTNAEEVFKSASFDTMPAKMLKELVADDHLCIEEANLFQALIRWAVCECKRRELADNIENQRVVLEELIPIVRYPLMTMEEVATYVSPSGMLSASQLLDVFAYLGKAYKGDKLPFSRVPRKPARSLWSLDRELLGPGIKLARNTATNSGSVDSWCQGGTSWSRGKHAWRVTRVTSSLGKLVIGMSTKVNHGSLQPQSNPGFWGVTTQGLRHFGGAPAQSTSVNFQAGPIDVLWNADKGTLTVISVNNPGQRTEVIDIPTNRPVVPHFGFGRMEISVQPIAVREIGVKVL